MCGRIDLDSLRRDRDQLWAEAAARYRQGEHWWLETSRLNTAAAEEQDVRYMADVRGNPGSPARLRVTAEVKQRPTRGQHGGEELTSALPRICFSPSENTST
jgi:hypothetical protein